VSEEMYEDRPHSFARKEPWCSYLTDEETICLRGGLSQDATQNCPVQSHPSLGGGCLWVKYFCEC
jgi:hypothetical protein